MSWTQTSASRKQFYYFLCAKLNASLLLDEISVRSYEINKSLIFQIIKTSGSIQDSNLSYNLDSSLLARLGLIQDKELAVV